MAVPKVIEGRYVVFELGNGGTPEVFTPICGMFVNSWNTTTQTTDRFLRDCDFPTQVPNRRPIATGVQEDITLSGYFTLDNRALVESLRGGAIRNVQLVVFEDDGVTEAGYYSGSFMFTAVNIGAPENDLATLELVMASTGSLSVWTDVAPPVLVALTLGTDTATVDTPWTSTIVGKTPGSTITAVSSDGTSLVVATDGLSVSGTFTVAGSPTVTLTESQPYAVGSPMDSTPTVTVT